MNSEQWTPVVGYEGFYEASSLGRIRSVERRVRTRLGDRLVPSKVLTPSNSNGYQLVMLNASGIGKRQLEAVHRIVAAAFICPRPSSRHQVNHIDGNKANNVPLNLEWVTPIENIHHGMRLGTAPRGDTHPSRKLSSVDAQNIRNKARQGESAASLGREFGVTTTSILNIIKGRTWREEQR